MGEEDNSLGALEKVKKSYRYILDKEEIPDKIREELSHEFDQLEGMLEKLENRELHITALGKVGVGKSAILNALVGRNIFEVGVLFGVTTECDSLLWSDNGSEMTGAILDSNLVLIDTPGFSEAGQVGLEHEKLSRMAAEKADIILFVCDSDLTASEVDLVKELAQYQKPIVVILNKVDRFSAEELEQILDSISNRWLKDTVNTENIITASADPRPVIVERRLQNGQTEEVERKRPADVEQLKIRILQILEKEGLDLLAVNSALFASNISDDISLQVTRIRENLSENVLAVYSTTKALVVALNPIPVADVLGGMAADAGMIIALAKLHGMPLTWRAAEDLASTIGKQMLLLAGTEVLTHIAADLLKGATFGLATIITALPQGLIAGYNSMIIGRAALVYFRQGYSWGPNGPKAVVKDILSTVDETTLISQMKQTILGKLKSRKNNG